MRNASHVSKCLVLGLALPFALGIGCSRNGDDAGSSAAPIAAESVAAAAASGGGATPTDGDRAEADQVFQMRCTPCHGPTGGGDGAASAALTPKPRNFHDVAWQQATSDDHLEKIVQFGGAAVGKSPAMPPNPDLTSKPGVVGALRLKIRSFAK